MQGLLSENLPCPTSNIYLHSGPSLVVARSSGLNTRAIVGDEDLSRNTPARHIISLPIVLPCPGLHLHRPPRWFLGHVIWSRTISRARATASLPTATFAVKMSKQAKQQAACQARPIIWLTELSVDALSRLTFVADEAFTQSLEHGNHRNRRE